MSVWLMRSEGLTLGLEGDDSRGKWLSAYDPDGDPENPYRGRIVWADDPHEAMQFRNFGEAVKCWKRVSKVAPLRPDEQPNRPLSAFTVSFMLLDEAVVAWAQKREGVR